ncbi:MAG: (Fe-S)-binding protein [Deltaproteobacteria bacterium]|nr:MAG: (Fe-S)-binding protein [Deltaproteobacteria bacterium]
MYKLQFDENICETCPTSDCLVKCQYIDMDRDTAHDEMMKIIKGEDSFVLNHCISCYACEEYCLRGNHPFYLITERREEKGILPAPRAITNQWINMVEPKGKYKVGEIKDKAISYCFLPELKGLAKGKLFEDVSQSYLFGAEFFCQVMYLHFAKTSIIKERLPNVIERIKQYGIKQLICMHDECYGSFASVAPAYGIDVPFEPIHYLEYLYNRLRELMDTINPLKIKVVYQRPCSSRLSSDKLHYVYDILALIGAELVERKYQGEKALCCGEIPRLLAGYEVANDLQKRNIDDMAESGAEYCVFNCPYCQMALSEKITKRGIKPIHIVDLCKKAIGEK